MRQFGELEDTCATRRQNWPLVTVVHELGGLSQGYRRDGGSKRNIVHAPPHSQGLRRDTMINKRK